MAAAMLLSGSEWGLAAGGEIFVQFNDGHVSGSSGCNRFAGSYEQDGERLKLRPLIVTRMACMDDGVMRKEQEFLGMLDATRTVDATHMRLVLKDADSKELAVLVRRDWD